MTEKKEEEFGLWAILGMAGVALAGLIASSFGNKNVNSYQGTSSYTPPLPPSTGGGCGCSAGR